MMDFLSGLMQSLAAALQHERLVSLPHFDPVSPIRLVKSRRANYVILVIVSLELKWKLSSHAHWKSLLDSLLVSGFNNKPEVFLKA